MNKYFLFYFRQNTLFVWFIRVRFQGLVWNLVKVWSVVLKEKHIGWPKDHFHPRLKTPFPARVHSRYDECKADTGVGGDVEMMSD